MRIDFLKLTANEIADPTSICYWNPDMYGVNPQADGAQAYYDSLLELYASWGVDFIKCDDICRMDASSSEKEIEMLHKAIENCERDVVLSLSPGPAILEKQEFYHKNANMWRITDDFWDHWESLRDMFDRCRNWQDYVKDGGYPDCDMLPLGKLGKGFGAERETNFTYEEQKTMLSLWTIFRSPLMLGTELPLLKEETRVLLTNELVYEMYHNARGAKEIYRDAETIVWETASETRQYTAIFNLTEKDMVLPSRWLNRLSANTVELWSKDINSKEKQWMIAPHGVLLFASPIKK